MPSPKAFIFERPHPEGAAACPNGCASPPRAPAAKEQDPDAALAALTRPGQPPPPLHRTSIRGPSRPPGIEFHMGGPCLCPFVLHILPHRTSFPGNRWFWNRDFRGALFPPLLVSLQCPTPHLPGKGGGSLFSLTQTGPNGIKTFFSHYRHDPRSVSPPCV